MFAMRLDGYLVKSGELSRSEAKKHIRAKRVSVNGVVVSDPSMHVDENADTITHDGIPVVYEQFRYYMLNKPQGCVSATEDDSDTTVLDLLDGVNKKDLFPVGRLDKDTEGLLLITNDGKLAHDMLSPRRHVDKRYFVETDRALTPSEKITFAEGLDIGDDKPTLPAVIEDAPDDEKIAYIVTIREGRFHQIKRMFNVFGVNVLFLKRVSMGTLELDESLSPGQFRPLTPEELQNLF